MTKSSGFTCVLVAQTEREEPKNDEAGLWFAYGKKWYCVTIKDGNGKKAAKYVGGTGRTTDMRLRILRNGLTCRLLVCCFDVDAQLEAASADANRMVQRARTAGDGDADRERAVAGGRLLVPRCSAVSVRRVQVDV